MKEHKDGKFIPSGDRYWLENPRSTQLEIPKLALQIPSSFEDHTKHFKASKLTQGGLVFKMTEAEVGG